jgi:spoIIIJ-associated protein
VSVAGAGRAKGSSLDVPEASDAAGLSGNGAAAEEPARSQSNRRRRSRGGGRTQTATAARDAAEGAESARGDGEDEDVRSASRQQHAGRARSNGLRHADETKEDVVGEDLSLEEQGEAARGFVEGLVHLLGLQGTVSTSVVDEETVQVAVDGAELGILIGPGGGTLAALQELARTVVQRQTGGRSERILVDVAGYRAKRAAALQRFTQQVAQEVLESSTERALEPMSASDRKIVHDTVNEIGGLVTRSVGEEPRRYIVVAPSSTSSAGHAEDEEPNDA